MSEFWIEELTGFTANGMDAIEHWYSIAGPYRTATNAEIAAMAIEATAAIHRLSFPHLRVTEVKHEAL